MTIWFTVSPAIHLAGQDAWISQSIAVVISLCVVLLHFSLSKRHPELSLIQFSRHIVGKWAGSLIGIVYLFTWMSVSAVILRGVVIFIQQMLFHNTPEFLLSFLIVIGMIYLVHKGGIQAVARFSEIIGPLILVGVITSLAMCIPNLKVELLMPIYSDHSLFQIFNGSLTLASFLGESMLIMMIYPHLKNKGRGRKEVVLAMLIPSVFVVISTMMVVATFGNFLGSEYLYPYFNMVRFISLLDFIQNMDVWIIFIWIFSVFAKLSLYLTLNTEAFNQLIGYKGKGKITMWVVGTVIYTVSLFPSSPSFIFNYPKLVWIPWVFPFCIIGLPLLLLVISSLRFGAAKRI